MNTYEIYGQGSTVRVMAFGGKYGNQYFFTKYSGQLLDGNTIEDVIAKFGIAEAARVAIATYRGKSWQSEPMTKEEADIYLKAWRRSVVRSNKNLTHWEASPILTDDV